MSASHQRSNDGRLNGINSPNWRKSSSRSSEEPLSLELRRVYLLRKKIDCQKLVDNPTELDKHDEGVFGHPVVLLRTGGTTVTVLIISSLTGKALQDFVSHVPKESRIKVHLEHIPIYPNASHYITGELLYFENERAFKEPSHLKILDEHTFPVACLRNWWETGQQELRFTAKSWEQVEKSRKTFQEQLMAATGPGSRYSEPLPRINALEDQYEEGASGGRGLRRQTTSLPLLSPTSMPTRLVNAAMTGSSSNYPNSQAKFNKAQRPSASVDQASTTAVSSRSKSTPSRKKTLQSHTSSMELTDSLLSEVNPAAASSNVPSLYQEVLRWREVVKGIEGDAGSLVNRAYESPVSEASLNELSDSDDAEPQVPEGPTTEETAVDWQESEISKELAVAIHGISPAYLEFLASCPGLYHPSIGPFE